MASARSEPLLNLDVFAEPVSLKFNAHKTYKTNVGGCVSVGFFTLSVFVVAAFLRSLITGFD
jgi:hypothetical protein